MAKKNIKKQKGFGESFFMVLGAIFILAAIFALPMITVWADSDGIDQTVDTGNKHYYVNPLTPWSAASTFIAADGSANTADELIPTTSMRYGADGTEAGADDDFQVSVQKFADQAEDADGAYIENQFDITLQVTTNQEVESLTEPQPASVVLTVDLSGSMQNENELFATSSNNKEVYLSNTDYDASKSQVDNLRAALREFVTEFHAGDVDRYVSFVGYNGFAYPITHADYAVTNGNTQDYNIGTNQVWYNLSDETDRNNAYAAINQIQELKYYGSDLADGGTNKDTRSAEDKSSAPERRYLVTYNEQDQIAKVYYVNNSEYTFNPTDDATATPQTLAYFLGEVDAFDGKLEAVSQDEFKALIAQPGTVYHNSYNDINNTHTSATTFSQGGFIVANSLYKYASKSLGDEYNTFNTIEDKNIIYFADGNANKTTTGDYTNEVKLNAFDYTAAGSLKGLGINSENNNGAGLANIQPITNVITKDNGIDITTILYETYDSSTQNNWLDKVQTRGFHAADSDIAGSLASVFAAILSNLTSGGTPWTVEDPMADYIDFVDFIAPEGVYATLFGASTSDDDNNTTEIAYINANDKLTWDLAKVVAAITSLNDDAKEEFYVHDADAGTHTYTLKYTATLDAHYKATEAVADGKVSSLINGKFYPTNEQTTLYYVNSETKNTGNDSTTTITGANGQIVDGEFEPAAGVAEDATFMAYTQDFNVPTVKALVNTLNFDKTDADGSTKLNGAKFSLWRYVGTGNPAEDSEAANWLQVGAAGAWVSQDGGKVSIPNLAKGHYRMQEVEAPSITIDGNVIAYKANEGYAYFEIAWGEIKVASDSWLETADGEYIVKNSPKITKTEHKVEKLWADDENIPTSLDITVKLYNINDVEITPAVIENGIITSPEVRTVKENASHVGNIVTLSSTLGWVGSFGLVDMNDADGQPINYIIIEDGLGAGYDVTYHTTRTVDATESTAKYILHSLTNDLDQVTIDIPVTKTWLSYSEDGTHEDIRIQLYSNVAGEAAAPVDGKYIDFIGVDFATGESNDSFTNLPKYDLNGEALIYSVQEFQLDENGDPVAVSDYAVDTINDQVAAVEFIAGSSDGFAIRNILIPGITSLSGAKTWVNPDQLAISDLQVTLYIDGSASTDAAHIINIAASDFGSENYGKYTFNNLPIYKYTYDNTGETEEENITGYSKIVYSVQEAFTTGGFDSTNWVTIYEEDSLNITNANIGSVSITVNKSWTTTEGNPTVTYTVYQDNVPYEVNGAVLSTTSTGTAAFTHTFNNLPKFDTLGNRYSYDVKESVTDAEGNTYLMASKDSAWSDDKNSLIVDFVNYKPSNETITISGLKTWLLPEDFEGSEPEVTIVLSSSALDENGAPVANQEIVLDGEGDTNGETADWVYTFSNLPKYYTVQTEILVQAANEDGSPKVDESGAPVMEGSGQFESEQVAISYTVTEENVAGYTTKYFNADGQEITATTVTETTTIDITNSRINEEEIDINAHKTWNWVDGIDLPKSITFELLIKKASEEAEGGFIYETTGKTIEVERSEYKNNLDGAILATFEDLAKYDENHQLINYWVVEEGSATYTSSTTNAEFAENGDQTVYIKNALNQKYSQIKVAKSWNKPEEIAKEAVQFTLYQDEVAVAVVDIAADVNYKDNKGAYGRTNFYKFVPAQDESGAYLYGYEANQGWPKYDLVTGQKHEYVIVETVKPSLNEFTNNAPTFEEANASQEDDIVVYEASFGKNKVTNTYVIDHLDFTAVKKWLAPEGTTFPIATFTLYRSVNTDYSDGEVVELNGAPYTLSTEATEFKNQKLTFTDLPRYSNDMQKYYYYVVEAAIDGYTATTLTPEDDGFEYTNKYNPDRIKNLIDQQDISITVTKNWEGTPAEGQSHPASVDVELLLGGQQIDSDPDTEGVQPTIKTIDTTTGSGSVTFDGLDKYDSTNGQLLSYSIREVDAQEVTAEDGSLIATYYVLNDNQVYTVEYAQPQMDLAGTSYDATITNSYANYLYQITRHYMAVIDGETVVDTFESDEVINIMHQNLATMTVNGVVDAGDTYIDGHSNFTTGSYTYDYIYQAAQGNRSVELVSPGVLYEINLYYYYSFTPDDPIRNPNPPGPTPGPDPDPDEPTPTIVDIAEDETPLANIPAPIPVAPVVEMPEEVLIIEDEVPLGNLPQTGSIGITFNVLLGLALLMFSVSGLMFSRKAR